MDKAAKTLVGMALGFTIGVAVGMAVAPQAGEETREKIKNRIKWQFWSPRERYMYLWKRTCGVG